MGETLAGRLLQSFGRYADRPAAQIGTKSISYGELGQRATAVAHRLAAHQIGPGDRVGLWMEKSFDSLAVLLGSLVSGATCVPLDVRASHRRVIAVAVDAGLSALAVDWLRRPFLPDLRGSLPGLRLVLEEGEPHGTSQPRSGLAAERPPPELEAEHPAYILYTSGGTARPLGVVISHRAALSFVDWCLQTLQPTPEDRMISHTPWHLDLSIFDLFVTLSAGASVRLLNGVESMLGPWIARHLSPWRITHWYSVPAALIAMLQGGLAPGCWPEAKVILFSGEPFPTPKLCELQRALPQARLINFFGPTETNVCAYHEVLPLADGETRPIPIGRICEHLQGAVLDERLREVARGDEGDLWIGGPNLFSGHWRRGALEARSLLPDPRPGRSGLVYNTGDRVRERDDGQLVHVGRRDQLVEVDGRRVELGQVESVIYGCPEVAEAAVVATPCNGSPALVAFVCWRQPGEQGRAQLLGRVKERVPLYMVPARFIFLEALPRTTNGKVDRQLLLEEASRRVTSSGPPNAGHSR